MIIYSIHKVPFDHQGWKKCNIMEMMERADF